MSEDHQGAIVTVTQFKWAGQWGPLRIRSHCQECDLVTSLLRKVIEDSFSGQEVAFEIKPWLTHWRYCLARGAWHPPIIMLNGKKFFQFSKKNPLFNREQLIAAIRAVKEGC